MSRWKGQLESTVFGMGMTSPEFLRKAAAWFARESDSIPGGGTRS